ncbi:hypothetical protein QWY84_19885 [Aquisalimonas lutea]|uniref:hypothetical protein n=1 Tax=Aquisalimonas lutea TaxID=1327750 RepID=UPI0025B4E4BF|nr:hypothetical protein [Aquisalimonas lutea]MDN3519870.1 hypothetical protein [Aquisalimonas lutea]
MHSRNYLRDSGFTVHPTSDRTAPGSERLQQHWRSEDRTAVVARTAEEGVRGCGAATLLLAHWFYRRKEARAPGFFDYPQHYAIVGESGARTRHLGPDEQRTWGAAWCRLDVWPSTHHVVAEPTPEALLLATLAVEPQWLFWPASLATPGPLHVAGGGDDRAVRLLLRARLRGVILYSTKEDGSGQQWSIELSGGARKLFDESMEALPSAERGQELADGRGWYRTVGVGPFLAVLASESGPGAP